MPGFGALKAGFSKVASSISRKKAMEEEASELARVLTIPDLTFLGVGATLGVGAYVLAGEVARDFTGPSVIIAFGIAAIASLLAGFCYAEFAARVPRAGSVYVYAYVTVGEFVAFAIGWDLILEYAIGTATLARAMTGYLDSMINHAMYDFFRAHMSINVPHMAPYPDFLGFGLVMILSVLLAAGIKESSILTSLFTVANLTTILVVVVAGAMYSKPSNWNISLKDIPPNATNVGTGGFAPFGFAGIIRGAAMSFFGYVGFDVIATTGEEAKNPRRNIPLAIMISLGVVFASYFSMATVLTMMVPYYTLDKYAPYPTAFGDLGLYGVRWTVVIGGVFALSTSLFGGMFPLPRIIFAMARDGLLVKFLSRVNSRTKTPIWATSVAGLFSGLMVLLFDLKQLVDMMSIGTLMAYSLVALCVIILRLSEDEDVSNPSTTTGCMGCLRTLVNADRRKTPTPSSRNLSMYLLVAFCALCFTFCGVISWSTNNFYEGHTPELASTVTIGTVLIVTVIFLSLQPQSSADKLFFAVPLMPSFPCLSILLNIYLMTGLGADTWTRFLVWLVIGAVMYFSYAIRHSVEANKEPADAAEMAEVKKEDKDVTAGAGAGPGSAPKQP